MRRSQPSLLIIPVILSASLVLDPCDGFCVSPHRATILQSHCSSRSFADSSRFSSLTVSSEVETIEDDGGFGKAKNMSGSNSTMIIDEVEIESAANKLRRLKDLMWVRETLEDLTAAEFACTVEALAEDPKRKRKRAVDYEKLLVQLNRRIRDLGCEGPEVQSDGDASEPQVTCSLESGVGMGSMVYTDNERTALMERIIATRQLLLTVIRENQLELGSADLDLPFAIALLPEVVRDNLPTNTPKPMEEELLTQTESRKKSSARVEPASKKTAIVEADDDADKDGKGSGPKLYVRDDGTVDWDGALQDQAALRKFGTAVWARINGRDPELATDEEIEEEKKDQQSRAAPKAVVARIEETPQIVYARDRLRTLEAELADHEKAHLALLNSVISAGQAVANVRLASLEPGQRNAIRSSASSLELLKERVTFQSLIYDLERIYTYLQNEVGNPALKGYIPLQDRLNVAEFGLLSGQIDALNQQLLSGEKVDADLIMVVSDQVSDFKRRLGIDYLVTGLSFDGEGIKRWTLELVEKTKSGLAFYVKGVRLFWNDNVYCLTLINRALQGYTLKPREVRTLRRTFKDIITFIPFVIILLIPLSPIGHVLVFGAIQRFFPDFFPSCFTEQRQNLLQLYETTEYSELTINENLKEKTSRIAVALVLAVANAAQTVYMSVISLAKGQQEGEERGGDDQ